MNVQNIRPFVPCKDFTRSRDFYKALGFALTAEWPGGALFSAGTQSFLLQDFYKKELVENFMMQLTVSDLDAWWANFDGLRLKNSFELRAPKAPEMQPWGMRVGFVFDPSGVLWHVAQAQK